MFFLCMLFFKMRLMNKDLENNIGKRQGFEFSLGYNDKSAHNFLLSEYGREYKISRAD